MRYNPDYTSTGKWMRSDPGLKAVIRDAAETGATAARATAAVGHRPSGTGPIGAHVRSIHVEFAGLGGAKHDRMEYDIVADAPHSALVEFGSPAHGRAPDYALKNAIIAIQGA